MDTGKLVSDWYVGEMRGEVFFTTMASRPGIASEEAGKWRLLAALEVAMGERLSRELIARGLSIPGQDASVGEAKRAGKKQAGLGWNEAMSSMQPRLEKFVDKFREQVAQMSADGAAIGGDYVAHEEALLEFVLKERAGRDGSIAITRLLCDQWGLPAP